MSLLRLVFLSWLGVLGIAGGTCFASEEDDRAAGALFEAGMAHFRAAEYDRAIASWEEAFHNRPAPEFLYNIGQAYRRLHRPEQAIPYYQRYLDLSPQAINHADIERLLETLKSETRAAAEPGATASPDARPSEAKLLVAPAQPRPLTRKAWFWGAIGGGVVLVAAAVTVAVVVTQRHDAAQSLPGVNFALRF